MTIFDDTEGPFRVFLRTLKGKHRGRFERYTDATEHARQLLRDHNARAFVVDRRGQVVFRTRARR